MNPKSKKPRKQRNFLAHAPLHARRKMMAGHLAKELRQKYGRRSMALRKGDEVEVMNGEFRKRHGKIFRLDNKKYKVYIEGLTIKRTDGTERMRPFSPSTLRVINLNLDDKMRVKILERKKNVKAQKTGSA